MGREPTVGPRIGAGPDNLEAAETFDAADPGLTITGGILSLPTPLFTALSPSDTYALSVSLLAGDGRRRLANLALADAVVVARLTARGLRCRVVAVVMVVAGAEAEAEGLVARGRVDER